MSFFNSLFFFIYLYSPLQLPSIYPCKLNQQLGRLFDESEEKKFEQINTRNQLKETAHITSTNSGKENKVELLTSPARSPRCSDHKDRRRLEENFPAFHGFPSMYELTISLSSISTAI